MTRFSAFCTLAAVIAAVMADPAPCLADTSVTLKPDVQVRTSAVRLSDLFTGVPAGIDRDIAQAPAACKPTTYDTPVLNRLAETYRLDWQPPAGSGADHATVNAGCARITADMIVDAARAKLKPQLDGKDRSFDLALDGRETELAVAADAVPDFTLANFAYDTDGKRFRAEVTAAGPRGPVTLPVTGHVQVRRMVPVLARHLDAGLAIGQNDLDWQQVPEEKLAADTVTDASNLIGRELRHDLAEGTPLRSHDIVAARLVTRGALITMKIETPFVTITAQGKAQQDGASGEVVRVLNTQSNRIVEGTVTGPGIVEIHTAQKLASAQ